jgi:hypothetical protein
MLILEKRNEREMNKWIMHVLNWEEEWSTYRWSQMGGAEALFAYKRKLASSGGFRLRYQSRAGGALSQTNSRGRAYLPGLLVSLVPLELATIAALFIENIFFSSYEMN